MENSDYVEMWQLMEKYYLEIDPASTTKENLSCILCKRLLIDACHSVCCCQYCFKCIEDYIGAGNKYCPGGKSKCREQCLYLETDVIRDRGMNRKIYNVMVQCPTDSCQYKCQMNQIGEHLRKCKIDITDCPYVTIGCGDRTENCKSSISSHLHNDSLAHTKLLIECVNSLKSEVSVLRSDVEVNKRESVTLREDVRKKETEISTLIGQMREQKRELEFLKENKIASLEQQLKREKIEMEFKLSEIIKEIKKFEALAENKNEQFTIFTNEQINKCFDQLIVQKKEVECLKDECLQNNTIVKTLEKQLKGIIDCVDPISKINYENKRNQEVGNVTKDQVAEFFEQLTKQNLKMESLKKEIVANENLTSTIEKHFIELKSEVELRLSKFDNETEKLKADLLATNKRIEVHRNEIKKKTTDQLKEKMNEVEYINEEFKKKENQISILNKQIYEIKNELNAVIKKTESIENLRDPGREKSVLKNDEITTFLMKQVRETEKKMNNLIKLCPNINVDYLWKIDGWTKKRETMRTTRIFSEAFYSNNYKMCLYLWIDNYGNTVLRCMILRGDNDDNVQWPMMQSVTLGIVDQDTMRYHKSVTLRYDTYKYDKSVFERPKSDMNNVGIGSSTLFDFSAVKDKPIIIVNDCLAVSCVLNDL